MDTIVYFDKYKKYKSKYLEFKKKTSQSGGSSSNRSDIWDEYKIWYKENLSKVQKLQEMFRLVSEEQKEEITEEIHNMLHAHDNSYPNKPGPVYNKFEELKVIDEDNLPYGKNFRESFQNSLINLVGNLKKKSVYNNYDDDFKNIFVKKINLSDSDYTDLALVIVLKYLIEEFNKLSIISEIPTYINPDTKRTEVLESITNVKNVNGKNVETAQPSKIPQEIKDIYKLNLQETNLSLEDLVLLYSNAVKALNSQQILNVKCGEVYLKKGFHECNEKKISDKKERIELFESEKNEILDGEIKLDEKLEIDNKSLQLLNDKIETYEQNINKTNEAIQKLKSEKKNILDRIYKNIPKPTPIEDFTELELLEEDYNKNGESQRESNLFKIYEKKFGIKGNSIEDLLESLSQKYSKDNDQNPKQTNFSTST